MNKSCKRFSQGFPLSPSSPHLAAAHGGPDGDPSSAPRGACTSRSRRGALAHKPEPRLGRSRQPGAACGAVGLASPAGCQRCWATFVREDLGENLPPFASPEVPRCDASPSFASRLCPEAAAGLNTNRVFWMPALLFPALPAPRAAAAQGWWDKPLRHGAAPQPGALSTYLHTPLSLPQLLQGIIRVYVC